MYPPVPGIGRVLSQPITFFDGKTVPAGKFSLFMVRWLLRAKVILKLCNGSL